MKRIFAAALAVCLMLLAAGAMAQGHGSDWTTITQSYCDSLDNGTLSSGKYCLGEEVACNFGIQKGATVTLCLCGYTISSIKEHDSAGQNAIFNEGSLMLEDCSAAKKGEVHAKDFGVYNEGVFTMNGGTVEGEEGGVKNSVGKVILNGGTVKSEYCGVENGSQFTMNGGVVTGYMGVYMKTAELDSQSSTLIMNDGAVKGKTYGVICATDEENEYGACSQFTMNAGTVTGGSYGVLNLFSKLNILEGTIDGGKYALANEDFDPFEEAEAEENYIAEGSYKESGAFGGKQVVIKKIPVVEPEEPADDPEEPAIVPELPKTGDSSMLLGWVALLGAAGAGLKLRRRG